MVSVNRAFDPASESDLNVGDNRSASSFPSLAPGKSSQYSSRTERLEQLGLLYSVEDKPPIYLSIIMGLQHMLMASGGIISVALLVTESLCTQDNLVKAEILNTGLFVSGVITFFQSTIGIRLPILQGATFTFLVPTFAILSLDKFRCDNIDLPLNSTISNATVHDPDAWKIRIREIQGAIIGASVFEVAIGVFGLMGPMLKLLGPIVIASVISLTGLSLFGAAAGYCEENWYVALMTMTLVLLFAQYLRKIKIPCCFYNRDRKKFACGYPYPVFNLYPIVLAILVAWFVCAILTWTNVFPNDASHFTYTSRVDLRSNVIKEAKWFRFPYPFQWGIPTFSTASVFGMLSGVLAGTIESIGDYFAAARTSGAPPPPVHAINRGILIEGLGCVLAGMWGTGSGTATYSENIGALSITRVGSRRVIQCAGILMFVIGMFGKVGALFVTIPEPVLGGVFMVTFGMIAAVGVSQLQYVDLNSARNLCIFGFAVIFGLSLPEWLKTNPDVINTGSSVMDQIFTVLLRTSTFVGGALAFLLDNTVPGSKEERGVDFRKREIAEDEDMSCYDLPYITPALRKLTWPRGLPFCPTFRSFKACCDRSNPEDSFETAESYRADGLYPHFSVVTKV